jgi:hypothetical protein
MASRSWVASPELLSLMTMCDARRWPGISLTLAKSPMANRFRLAVPQRRWRGGGSG